MNFTALAVCYVVQLTRSQNVSKFFVYFDPNITKTSTYVFPSMITAEIRNAIYGILTAYHSPTIHLTKFGELFAIHKQLRTELASLLRINAISVGFESMTDFFDTFLIAECLAQRCAG